MNYKFVITKQPELVAQYYALRELCFREELGLPDFDGSEDEHDCKGTLVLALDKSGEVVAGARICGSYPDSPKTLPVENANFKLKEFFPRLGLNKRPYCYWGRLVIHPRERGNAFSKLFLSQLLSCSHELGFDFAFIVTDMNRSRYYRLLHRSLGYDYEICDDEIPTDDDKFSGLQHLVSYSALQSSANSHRYQFSLDKNFDTAALLAWQSGTVGHATRFEKNSAQA